MNKHSSKELDAVYQALANATRRKILTRLCGGECTVGELAKPFNMTLAGVSKHIKVLEKAGLVRKRNNGPEHICSIQFEPIASAAALVHYFEEFHASAGTAPASAEAPAARETVHEEALEIA